MQGQTDVNKVLESLNEEFKYATSPFSALFHISSLFQEIQVLGSQRVGTT
jgi:hypothetical protein